MQLYGCRFRTRSYIGVLVQLYCAMKMIPFVREIAMAVLCHILIAESGVPKVTHDPNRGQPPHQARQGS